MHALRSRAPNPRLIGCETFSPVLVFSRPNQGLTGESRIYNACIWCRPSSNTFRGSRNGSEPAGQPSAETMKTFASSADVEALMAKAKGDLKGQYAVAENLLRSGPYRVNLEYRVGLHRSTI